MFYLPGGENITSEMNSPRSLVGNNVKRLNGKCYVCGLWPNIFIFLQNF